MAKSRRLRNKALTAKRASSKPVRCNCCFCVAQQDLAERMKSPERKAEWLRRFEQARSERLFVIKP